MFVLTTSKALSGFSLGRNLIFLANILSTFERIKSISSRSQSHPPQLFYLELAAPEIGILFGRIHDEGFGADEGDGELFAEGVVEDPGAEAWVVM